MPKAAVDEKDDAVARKDEVGRPGQAASMEPEPQTHCVSRPANHHLGRGVLPTNARHQRGTLRRRRRLGSFDHHRSNAIFVADHCKRAVVEGLGGPAAALVKATLTRKP
jgi:hypothetical protein